MFTDFQQFDVAAHAYAHEGFTAYRGREDYAGRYIVGGLATRTIPHDVPNYAALCLESVLDLALGASDLTAETLGVWHEGGIAHFDLGDSYTIEYVALKVARGRGELAIWDRFAGRVIRVANSL